MNSKLKYKSSTWLSLLTKRILSTKIFGQKPLSRASKALNQQALIWRAKRARQTKEKNQSGGTELKKKISKGKKDLSFLLPQQKLEEVPSSKIVSASKALFPNTE